MSDLIRREDAYAAIRGLTRHIDRIAAITALPAVQPDRMICGLPVCECGMTGPCKAPVPAVQLTHVNETPKIEHDARVMLTPATKEGDA